MFLQSRSFKLNPKACSDSELSCLLLGAWEKTSKFFFCLAFSFWQVSKEPSLCVTSWVRLSESGEPFYTDEAESSDPAPSLPVKLLSWQIDRKRVFIFFKGFLLWEAHCPPPPAAVPPNEVSEEFQAVLLHLCVFVHTKLLTSL